MSAEYESGSFPGGESKYLHQSLDARFFDDFFAHRIKIAPGDSIEVKLKIYQLRDQDTGIFTNQRYEVVEVLRHIPRMKQIALREQTGSD